MMEPVTCPVCHDDITSETGCTTLSCNHKFHLKCIVRWLVNPGPSTCPCCRSTLTQDETINDIADPITEDEDLQALENAVAQFLTQLPALQFEEEE